ncbi:hypothetical protein [uncultured Draconibacterium sp.]|uniref:hypothetical protein n=1 Tax=uncultured Draconibacterium sp. TaxID=1573823 RepID=UPI003217D4C0
MKKSEEYKNIPVDVSEIQTKYSFGEFSNAELIHFIIRFWIGWGKLFSPNFFS